MVDDLNHLRWLPQVPTEVNNRVQSLLLNYHLALLCSGDFTLVYYQMGELEYIRTTYHLVLIFLRKPILLISQCMEMNRWLLLYFIYIPQSPSLDQYYH